MEVMVCAEDDLYSMSRFCTNETIDNYYVRPSHNNINQFLIHTQICSFITLTFYTVYIHNHK